MSPTLRAALGGGMRAVPVCAALSLALAGAGASAEEVQGGVSDLHGEVLDLHYAVEDVGGGVVDLAPKESETEVRYALSGDVLFAFDRATIRPDAQGVLGKLAEEVRTRFPGAPVRVEGHTDAKGGEDYNQRLSLRRAEAVKAWLVAEGGLEAGRITTRGFGESRPLAPNATPDGRDDPVGRQKNRRVEIVVEKR